MSAAVLPANKEKRPLELNNSDDETENEDQQAGKVDKEKQAELEADELIVKKKVRHSKPFTEDLLTLPDGLQRIYEEFPIAGKFRGRGSEGKDIKKLLAMYREWAFQLHPGMAPSDVIARCEVLGAKGKTKSCLQNLRDRERSRYITDVIEASKRSMESPIFQLGSGPMMAAAGTATAAAAAAEVSMSSGYSNNSSNSSAQHQQASELMMNGVEDSFTSPEAF